MAAEHRGLHFSRRRFVQGAGAAGLGLLAGCGRLPWQASKLPRIGFLSVTPKGVLAADEERFVQQLRELGYTDGQNLFIEWRWADGQPERLPALATELVQSKVDLMVAVQSEAIQAAKEATTVIPIVMMRSGAPVEQGFVASLAHPGGNVTGMATIAPELGAKRLDLLREVMPEPAPLAVLWNGSNSAKIVEYRNTAAAARTRGIELRSLDVRQAVDFSPAFDSAVGSGVGGLLILVEGLIQSQRPRIVDFATAARLPAMSEAGPFTQAGALMSYGVAVGTTEQGAARFVDRILKGAEPANLPVELPMRYHFAINLKTAQALGLTIPQHVLLQATEIIQ